MVYEDLNEEQKNQLRGGVYEMLKGTYHCTKDWDYWALKLMDEDDFECVSEDEDQIDDLARELFNQSTNIIHREHNLNVVKKEESPTPLNKKENEVIDGVCCEFCTRMEGGGCPVITANPWSRWKNFCSEFSNVDSESITEIKLNSTKKDK